jgi:hypothetical protein
MLHTEPFVNNISSTFSIELNTDRSGRTNLFTYFALLYTVNKKSHDVPKMNEHMHFLHSQTDFLQRTAKVGVGVKL